MFSFGHFSYFFRKYLSGYIQIRKRTYDSALWGTVVPLLELRAMLAVPPIILKITFGYVER